MFTSPQFRSLALTTAAIWLGLVIALSAAGFDLYFKTPIFEFGDSAVNSLQVDHAKHFKEIYGNYSRWEFNHPGPVFFYVFAAGEWLFHDVLHLVPSPHNAHQLTSMALQSLFFALGLALFATHQPWRAFLPLALLAAALHFGALHDAFISIWPPHLLLMPFFCFLVACVSVATGRSEHLPIAVVTGGFLFHGHVAQPLFVGGLGGLAVGLCAWRLRPPGPNRWRQLARSHRPLLLKCAAIGFIFLLPLIIDVITGGLRSNVAGIFGRFYANTGDHKSLLQTLLYFFSFATDSRDQEIIFASLGPQVPAFFAAHAGRMVIWSCILLLPPALAVIFRQRLPLGEGRFFATAYGFLVVTIGLCLLWGLAQAGPMFQFNGYFYYSIYYFCLLLALGLLARTLERVSAPPVAAVLCAATAVIFTWSLRPDRLSESEAGQTIKRGIEDALKANPGPSPKLLIFAHTHWPTAISVGLELQRRGIPFYTPPWWGFMVGARHELPDINTSPEDKTSVWWITTSGPGGQPISPQLSIYTEPAPIRPEGDELHFRAEQNGFRYLVAGLGAGVIEYAVTDLPRLVFLFAPQPSQHDVRIIFDARTQTVLREQPADVYFNRQRVGRVVAGPDRGPIVVTVPKAMWNDAPKAKLELRFPDAVPFRSYKRPRYQSWAAWDLWGIRFESDR